MDCVMHTCKEHFESPGDMIRHLTSECTKTATGNVYCGNCKAHHELKRGPTSKTLKKTVQILRRLSGSKKHGRGSTDGRTPLSKRLNRSDAHAHQDYSVGGSQSTAGLTDPTIGFTPQDLADMKGELEAFNINELDATSIQELPDFPLPSELSDSFTHAELARQEPSNYLFPVELPERMCMQ